jgi:nucleotide-binding universal stress UspA family protein
MIAPIEKILYATDLSKNSLYAFGHAIQVARQCKATITVLHVVEPAAGTLGNWVKEKTEEEELSRSVEAIRGQLERFCEVMDPDRACIEYVANILVRVGEPVGTILEVADEKTSSIIVLGAHAKGRLKNTLLGSVSRRVLDRASIPTIIIPLPKGDANWERLEAQHSGTSVSKTS